MFYVFVHLLAWTSTLHMFDPHDDDELKNIILLTLTCELATRVQESKIIRVHFFPFI